MFFNRNMKENVLKLAGKTCNSNSNLRWEKRITDKFDWDASSLNRRFKDATWECVFESCCEIIQQSLCYRLTDIW